MLNTVIFTIGIMANMYQVTQQKFSSSELIEAVAVAFFHAARGWETSGEYVDKPIEERKKKYIELNGNNYNHLKQQLNNLDNLCSFK